MAVTFFFQLFDGNEAKRSGVDAITHPALISWAVVEEMAEMRIAVAAADFGAFHSERAVRFFGDVALRDRLGETGPAAPAVELIERCEKRFATDNIDINAGPMIVPILISKRRFGPALLSDAILFRREFLFQFLRWRLDRSLVVRRWSCHRDRWGRWRARRLTVG